MTVVDNERVDSTDQSGQSVDYAKDLAEAQEAQDGVDALRAERLAIQLPEVKGEEVTELFRERVELAESIVGLVKDNEGQAAAEQVAARASETLGQPGQHRVDEGGEFYGKGGLPVAKSIVESMGDVANGGSHPVDRMPLPTEFSIGTTERGASVDYLNGALRLIGDSLPSESRARLENAVGALKNEPGKEQTIETGVLGTAINVKPTRVTNKDGSEGFVYEVAVVSTIDRGARQSQQEVAATEGVHTKVKAASERAAEGGYEASDAEQPTSPDSNPFAEDLAKIDAEVDKGTRLSRARNAIGRLKPGGGKSSGSSGDGETPELF